MNILFGKEELDPFADSLYMRVKKDTDDAADMVSLYYDMSAQGYEISEIIEEIEEMYNLPNGQISIWLSEDQL